MFNLMVKPIRYILTHKQVILKVILLLLLLGGIYEAIATYHDYINDVDITSYDSDPTTGASFWKDLISEVVIYPTISGHCLAYIKDNNGDIITEYNRMGAYSIGAVGVSASSLYTSNSSFQVAISYVNNNGNNGTFTGFVISPKTN